MSSVFLVRGLLAAATNGSPDYFLIRAILISIDWERWDVVVFFAMFVIFISLGSYGLGISIRDKKKRRLEKLIKKRTSELEQTNAELQHRNNELDRFVYSASHDLSAPLKSIMGIIHVARLEEPESTQRQYLDMIEKSILKLEGFIDEVIQYSRNARLPIDWSEVEFRRLVTDLLIDYQFTPGFNQIKITIEAAEGAVLVTDAMRLKIVLNNLISNAIKFKRSDDEIVPEIRIAFDISEEKYTISVTDNGKGIQSEYVDKIFEMFFRASEDVPGSGLGLYILKETVARMEGSIQVQSKLGQGTTFMVSLPKIHINSKALV